MGRHREPVRLAEAKLFGALQRTIDLWRTGDMEAVEDQRMVVADRVAGLRALGGDPGVVVLAVWGREVNADVAGRLEPVTVFGRV